LGYERLVAIGKPILEGSSQGQKRSTTQILTLSDPKIKGQEPKTLSTRAHNPPVERGWADKADSRPPLRGPGGWGGDWYVWHAPDGLRARAATGLGCMQAGAEKLGVIEASYASAIIGVLSPVSSHCLYSDSDFFQRIGGNTLKILLKSGKRRDRLKRRKFFFRNSYGEDSYVRYPGLSRRSDPKGVPPGFEPHHPRFRSQIRPVTPSLPPVCSFEYVEQDCFVERTAPDRFAENTRSIRDQPRTGGNMNSRTPWPPVVPPPSAPDELRSIPTLEQLYEWTSVPDERVVIRGVDWAFYEQLVDSIPEGANIHRDYDGKDLEIMGKGRKHEGIRELFGYLVRLITEELEIPCKSLGETTWKRPAVARGLEADQCYYFLPEKLAMDAA